MSRHALVLVLLASMCSLWGSERVQAQAGEVDELQERARVAAEEGRLSDAATLLTTALERAPSAAVAFNLALVRRNQGQLLAARDLFERLLDDEFGELPTRRAARARELIREVEVEIASLEVSVQGADRAEIRIDGREVGATRGSRSLRVEVDPGERVVSATSGTRTVDREVEVARGARLDVNLTLAPELPGELPGSASDRLLATTTEENEPAPRGRRAALVITALAVVAGGVALALVLSRQDSLPSPPDHFIGTTAALR